MTYILLTRPEADNRSLEEQLLEPVASSPVLKVAPLLSKLALPKDTTDLILTSSRVLEILENIRDFVHLPVWCVGDVTAKMAKDKGFETIYSVGRSAHELLEKIAQETKPTKSHFVHLCGETLHLDVTEALQKLGFKADKIVVYTTNPAEALSGRATKLIKSGLISLIPFYSKHTAEVFVDLVKKGNVSEHMKSVVAIAHSDAVADALQPLTWKKVIINKNLNADLISKIYQHHKRDLNPMNKALMSAIVAALVSVAVLFSLRHYAFPEQHEIKPAEIEHLVDQKLAQFTPKTDSNAVTKSDLEALEEKMMAQLATVEKKQEESQTELSRVAAEKEKIETQAKEKSDKFSELKILRHTLVSAQIGGEEKQTLAKLLPEKEPSIAHVLSLAQLRESLGKVELSEGKKVQVEGWLNTLLNKIGISIRKKEVSAGFRASLTNLLQTADLEGLKKLEETQFSSPGAQEWLKQLRETLGIIDLVDKKIKGDNTSTELKKEGAN